MTSITITQQQEDSLPTTTTTTTNTTTTTAVAREPLEMSTRITTTRRSNVPGLVCAFTASATTGGTIYAFGIYGDALKKSLNLTQLQLNAISATFFMAGLFTWIPGMVVDRMGMRFSMSLGGTTGALSTIIYWCVARQFLPTAHHAVAMLSVLAVAICLSCGLIIGSIFKLTMICGGRESKGAAVGVAKGFVGLGAGVYATIFQALRTSHESALDFIPVIAFFFILCAAIPPRVLLPAEPLTPSVMQMDTTPRHFQTLYISLCILGCVIVASSIADIVHGSNMSKVNDDNDDEMGSTRNYKMVAFILVIWLGPIASLLFMPKRELHYKEGDDFEKKSLLPTTTSKNDESIYRYQQPEQSPEEPATNDFDKQNNLHQEKHDLNLAQMLQTPSAWLMLWTTTILVGSGTYKTNNMGEMVESLGFSQTVTPATLAIFSVAQAVARIVTGVVSETALHHWRFPSICYHGEDSSAGISRPFFLVVACVICFCAQIMLAITTTELSFVIGCALSAIAFGMAWPLMVLVVGDIFGLEHHGANYMFYDGSTKALGTIFLSEVVAGNVYEAHVNRDVDALVCYGPTCFRDTHLAVAALALTGAAASLALIYTSRDSYKNNHLHCR